MIEQRILRKTIKYQLIIPYYFRVGMDYLTLMLSWFAFGVLAEMLFLLGGRLFVRETQKKFFWTLIASILLTGFFILRSNHPSPPNIIILYWLVSSVIVYGLWFKSEVLPNITEQTVLSYTILFWYVMLAYIHPTSGFWRYLSLLALIPSAASVVNAFVWRTLRPGFKLFFYVWFIIVVVVLTYSQFSFGHLSVVWKGVVPEASTPADLFFTGMVCIYLGINIFYLWELIPFPGKYQKMEDKIRQCKEHAKIMVSKYLDIQLTHTRAILLLLVEAGGLTLNFHLKLVSDYLLINILLLFMPQILERTTTETETQIFTQTFKVKEKKT